MTDSLSSTHEKTQQVSNAKILSNEDSSIPSTEITIHRCPHDAENPYTMLHRGLVRDETVSPNCRWLISYLLTNAPGWVIRIQQILAHVKPHMGREKLRSVFKEAIEAGYIKREELTIPQPGGGSLKQTRYLVSEIPKFKKFNRETAFRAPGDPSPKNKQDTSYLKKEQSSYKVPEEPSAAKAAVVKKSPEPKKKKADFSPEIVELANKMTAALAKAHPDWLVPKNMTPIMSQIHEMIFENKRDPKRILEVFIWAINDAFWTDKFCKANPAKYLKDRFAQLAGKMNAKPLEKTNKVDRRLRDKEGNCVDQWKDDLF